MQFGFNSTSEWLLIARGEAECNYAMLLIANHKPCQVATISMSMYEIGKFIVYKFTAHCIVYTKLLLLTSLQFYSTTDSLQQIVGT